MRIICRSRPEGPVAAAVGTWDPLVAEHVEMLRQMALDCADRGLTPLVVLLEPDPRMYLFGSARWPFYHDHLSRVVALRRTGAKVLVWRFDSAADVRVRPSMFFDVLTREVSLSELWIAPRQNLGNGTTPEVTAELARQHGVRLHFIAPDETRDLKAEVRILLEAGRVSSACELVGHPPARRRPATGRLRMAWAPGRYVARPVKGEGSELSVDLLPSPGGGVHMVWPSPKLKAIEFLRGPGEAGHPIAVP